MPYIYSNKKLVQTKILERVSSIILFPFQKNERKRSKDVKSILLIEPFQMGDVLSLTPLIEPLKKKYNNAKIFVLTKPGSGGILKFDSRISEVLSIDFSWSDYGLKSQKLKRIFNSLNYVFSLRKHSFDIGIDTRGDIRSQILMVLAGCKERIGFTNYLHSNIYLRGLLLTIKVQESKMIHRYEWNLSLLSSLGFSENELYPIKFPCFFPDKLNLEQKSQNYNIVLHIGGGWKYKRWEEEKWVDLINALSDYRNQNLSVIAGGGEKEILDRIKKIIPERNNIIFKITSFEELIEYIYRCDKFIGLDSGPMNLAVCLNKPVVALFGPGDSSMWFPLNVQGKFIHKKENFSCNPCMQTECFYSEKNCMMSIEVDEVVELLN
jgi:ADP-heptose:LPS heptosyltransferase